MVGTFEKYNGDLSSLPTSETHTVFRWHEPGCKILFSATRQGNAMSCHFSSDRRGLRKLKQAIDEFCNFCIETYKWCTMIIAKIKKNSVVRLVEKCGFKFVLAACGGKIYARCKHG